MPTTYDDKRARYKGHAPHEFSATPKFDNPRADKLCTNVPAIRGLTAPRDAFRVASAPKPPEPLPEPPKPYVEPIPSDEEL